MPLEISEIDIQMRVGEAHRDAAAPREEASGEGCSDNDRAAIVEDCLRRVLHILKHMQGR